MHYNYKTVKSKKLAEALIDIVDPFLKDIRDIESEFNNSTQLVESSMVMKFRCESLSFTLSIVFLQLDFIITLAMSDQEVYRTTVDEKDLKDYAENIVRDLKIACAAVIIDMRETCSINGG